MACFIHSTKYNFRSIIFFNDTTIRVNDNTIMSKNVQKVAIINAKTAQIKKCPKTLVCVLFKSYLLTFFAHDCSMYYFLLLKEISQMTACIINVCYLKSLNFELMKLLEDPILFFPPPTPLLCFILVELLAPVICMV